MTSITRIVEHTEGLPPTYLQATLLPYRNFMPARDKSSKSAQAFQRPRGVSVVGPPIFLRNCCIRSRLASGASKFANLSVSFDVSAAAPRSFRISLGGHVQRLLPQLIVHPQYSYWNSFWCLAWPTVPRLSGSGAYPDLLPYLPWSW